MVYREMVIRTGLQINYPSYIRDLNHSQKLQKHPESKQTELQIWSEGSLNTTT